MSKDHPFSMFISSRSTCGNVTCLLLGSCLFMLYVGFDGNGSFRRLFLVSAGLLHDTVEVLIFGGHIVL